MMARHRRADADTPQAELPRDVEETALVHMLALYHLPRALRIRPVVAIRRNAPKDAA